MDRIVVDSSVVVKLFLDEEYSNNAYALRDSLISREVRVAVPTIFPYEILNALRYSKDYDGEELEQSAESIIGYGFDVFNMNTTFAKNTVKIAKKYDITIYDASYVALALMIGSKFYTADEKLIADVKLPFVRHIKEFV
jgi:predicted nucleic acid-binding protein